MTLLDIEPLAFHVAGQVVLADVEMTVGEREIHALLGANGTGKTTLACLLMGLPVMCQRGAGCGFAAGTWQLCRCTNAPGSA